MRPRHVTEKIRVPVPGCGQGDRVGIGCDKQAIEVKLHASVAGHRSHVTPAPRFDQARDGKVVEDPISITQKEQEITRTVLCSHSNIQHFLTVEEKN